MHYSLTNGAYSDDPSAQISPEYYLSGTLSTSFEQVAQLMVVVKQLVHI